MIQQDVISGKIAKDVLVIMWDEQKSPQKVVEEQGLQQITDPAVIENALRDVLIENSSKVAEYKSGKDKLFGFFIGQAMKKTHGKANPQLLNDILSKLLSE